MTLLQLLECMNNPKITVVTVCYNAVDVIEKTILSVINQTYSNIEYIVIDGNSSDGTVNIIKKYADRISKWVSEPDKGIYDAMNKGTDLATGEWINFMNAGDFFVNDSVIEDIRLALQEKHDVVYGNTIFVNGGRKKFQKAYTRENTIPSFCHQSSFISTQLMKRYYYDQSFIIAADTDFFDRIYKEGCDFFHVDLFLSMVNMDGVSSNRRTLVYREVCRIKKIKPSMMKLLKYQIEDAMPVWLMKRLLNLSWLVK